VDIGKGAKFGAKRWEEGADLNVEDVPEEDVQLGDEVLFFHEALRCSTRGSLRTSSSSRCPAFVPVVVPPRLCHRPGAPIRGSRSPPPQTPSSSISKRPSPQSRHPLHCSSASSPGPSPGSPQPMGAEPGGDAESALPKDAEPWRSVPPPDQPRVVQESSFAVLFPKYRERSAPFTQRQAH
jgi:hypothetical protein